MSTQIQLEKVEIFAGSGLWVVDPCEAEEWKNAFSFNPPRPMPSLIAMKKLVYNPDILIMERKEDKFRIVIYPDGLCMPVVEISPDENKVVNMNRVNEEISILALLISAIEQHPRHPISEPGKERNQ